MLVGVVDGRAVASHPVRILREFGARTLARALWACVLPRRVTFLSIVWRLS